MMQPGLIDLKNKTINNVFFLNVHLHVIKSKFTNETGIILLELRTKALKYISSKI